MGIAFSDIERLFDEKTGRAIRVIRLLPIPAAVCHHNRMDPWRMVDACLGGSFMRPPPCYVAMTAKGPVVTGDGLIRFTQSE
jgi:hypothetical protein